MDTFILYLCSVAEGISVTIGIPSIIGLIIYMLSYAMYLLSNKECCANDEEKFLIPSKIFIISLIGLFVSMCIPNKKDCYIIFGLSKTIEYYKSSEEIQKLPDNAIKALNCYLEEVVKEEPNNK